MRGYSMKTPERVACAQELRARGLTYREIGERIGVGWKSVYNWIDDPDGSKKRARVDSYRGTCVDCGAPTDGSAGRDAAPARCMECNGAHTRKLTRRWILDSFAEWHRLFDEPPGAADWEPHILPAGRARDRAAERRAATARPWPGPTVVANHFGSWNAGVEAAGFTACAPGERRDPDAWRVNLTAATRKAKGTAARQSFIATLFDEGLTYREIAAEMGVKEGTIAQHIYRMRREGWVLPHRTPGPRAAEAVVA